MIGSAWRAMFLIGLAPALLAIPIFLRLKEPERWKAAAQGRGAGAGRAIPGTPTSSARSPSCSATRAGGGTRSSA